MICPNPSCGFDSPSTFAQCPRCRTWIVGSPQATAAGTIAAPGVWAPKLLSRVAQAKLHRKSLGHPALDHLFGGGPVMGCAYLLNGKPGAGKSRLMLQFASWFEAPLYLSAEESAGAVKLRMSEMGIQVPKLRIVETRDLEFVAKHVTSEYDLVILDSAHRMRTNETTAMIGSALQASSVIGLATDIAHQLGLLMLIVGHVNKEGEASGMVANEHEVDATLMLEKTGGVGRKLTIEKNRHGPDPISVTCHMTAAGLDGFTVIEEGEEDHGVREGLGSGEKAKDLPS